MTTRKSEQITTSNRHKQGTSNNVNNLTGIYIGEVTDTVDSRYTGTIRVNIPEFGTAPGEADRIILLTTPYGGVTHVKDSAASAGVYGEDTSSENGTPKSYGMWPQPPVVGTPVVVAFTASSQQGFLVGTLMSMDRNFMMGGRASAENVDSEVIEPVGEKNPYDLSSPDKKPVDTQAKDQLVEQGLDKDYVRGHSLSSARRETPSSVFGITTLNGHVFTMDDGDEDGNSRNIRLRSRQGAQVLIDDTNKMIFINNHKGNAWIEIDEDGKIDVFSEDKISIQTEDDFNVYAKGNINLESEQGVNIASTGSDGVKLQATVGSFDLTAQQNFNLTAKANANVNVVGSYKETAGRIDMNGPVADLAKTIPVNSLISNTNVITSINSRVPEHHPWNGATKTQEQYKTAKGNSR